jgi:predicted  nucleic acid-binding Zn-ribbon protein
MPRPSSKERAKGGDPAEESTPRRSEPPPADPLQALRGELMRTQRDLEASRLELQEQKRKAAQHAMVHSAELKDARSERDSLRMQLDAVRAELARPARRKATAEEDDRTQKLEAELEEARGEEAALRKKLSEATQAAKALEAELAKLKSERDQAAAVLSQLQRELTVLKSQPPPAPTPAPPVAAEPPAAPQKSFFGKLFGRR